MSIIGSPTMAALVVFLVCGLAHSAQGQTKGEFEYDESRDAARLLMRGETNNNIAVIRATGTDNNKGMLRIYDNGNIRISISVNDNGEPAVSLSDAQGTFAELSNRNDRPQLDLHGDDGNSRAIMIVDNLEQGRLRLGNADGNPVIEMRSDEDQRPRLELRDRAGDVVRAELAVSERLPRLLLFTPQGARGAVLELDEDLQGRLSLRRSDGFETARLGVGQNGSAELVLRPSSSSFIPQERARLDLDQQARGRLQLRSDADRIVAEVGTDPDSSAQHPAVRLFERDPPAGELEPKAVLLVGEDGHGELALRSHLNNGASVLLSALGSEQPSALRLRDSSELDRLSLAVTGTGQGSLVIRGSEVGNSDETRVALAVDDEDSGFLRLRGDSNEQIVSAASVPGSPDHGRLQVALEGTTAGVLQATPIATAAGGARGGNLVLYRVAEDQQSNTATPTIFLDGRTGNLFKAGFNAFLVDHPEDPDLAINYVSLEGRQADIYVRETIRLAQGEARWEPPDDWSLLVRPDSITVHCTPNSADAAGVAVVSKSPAAIEIRALRGGSDSFEADCLAFGTRNDIDLVQTLRPRTDFVELSGDPGPEAYRSAE